MHCYPRMGIAGVKNTVVLTSSSSLISIPVLTTLTARKIYFHKFVHEKMFFFVRYITNHLKTGPSGNS